MRRAEAAGEYLMIRGVSDDRITVESQGESQAMGSDESGWRIDRRVEVRRTGGEPARDRP
jgi:outer membrane protein OmpA-like peptidoglycan-associated protein